MDDGSIQSCLDDCVSHWSVLEDSDNVKSVIALVCSIGARLLHMPEQDRERLYEIRWGRSATSNAISENTTQQT